jgi:hypothetical protein
MTDGTDRPDGAAAPGQGVGPQPAPPQQPAGFGPPIPPSGYGYPHQGPGPQQPPYAQQGFAPGQPAPVPGQRTGGGAANEPNWEAMANRFESEQRRKRRMWTLVVAAVACVLGAGAGALYLTGSHGKHSTQAVSSPTATAPASASAGPSGSTKPVTSPTVQGDPNRLLDHSGQTELAIGPDAAVNKVTGGWALRLRADANSYAQSASQLIDVRHSFSVSAWVYNESAAKPRMAISQGDVNTFSFALGVDASGGKGALVFKVQSAAAGTDSTVFQVRSTAAGPANQWVLLTGTYDASSHTIALYVNGNPAGTTKVPGIYAAPGAFQLGRVRQNGLWDGYWAGVIGHVLVWNQALTPDQVANVKGGGSGLTAQPIASWLVG